MRTVLTVSITALMALPVFADVAIEDVMAQHAQAPGVAAVESMDISQSGVDEILIRMSEGCEEASCPWILNAYDGQDWFEVSRGSGVNVALTGTGEAGGVLDVDGVTWALDGHSLYPFGDVIGSRMNRAVGMDDMKVIQSVEGYGDLATNDVLAWSFEYSLEGETRNARVFTISDWDLQVGSWGTPWLVVEQGEVIATGHSTDFPRIFPHFERGGYTIVEVHPMGYSLQVVR